MKSEVGMRKSEKRKQSYEVGSRIAEVGMRNAEVGSRNAEIGMNKGRGVDCNTAYRCIKYRLFPIKIKT